MRLFLCGDVMTGRGIDQILPHPSNPILFEAFVRSAEAYVRIAEQATGAINRPVDFAYVWGDALAELDRMAPDVRIINLETAITTAQDAWPHKGIHYRMHPGNMPALTCARIDCCVLANNHVLDWGYGGLAETLRTLRAASVRTAGAGSDLTEAAAPAVIQLPANRRVLVFAMGMESAGVPRAWAAGAGRPGVNVLPDLSVATAETICRQINAVKRSGDFVVASIHWGENWGYEISRAERAFAHRLIEGAGVSIVHGHSSHHPKGIEVHGSRLILYGCGDFLNDYEGIGGYESLRPELALMYCAQVDAASGSLRQLALTPMRIRNFRLNRVEARDVRWLETVLNREGRMLGTFVECQPDGTLALRWQSG